MGTQVRVEPHHSGRPGLLTVAVAGQTDRGWVEVTKTVSDPLAIDEAVTDLCLAYGIEEER